MIVSPSGAAIREVISTLDQIIVINNNLETLASSHLSHISYLNLHSVVI
jgi:hypothetical protein